MKKINMALALQALEQMDPWEARAIGRKAGLPMWRELISEARTPQVKSLLEQAYTRELDIIKACKAKDEAKFNRLSQEIKDLTTQVTEAAE